ncbi:aldo-keto reductase family 1 member B1-like [Hylaeus volcanicus]|uniref:aldo-keto reductase family 1 member B1-like n=1 Tax=Hylaeus volcanicus TaxID=313075 RepID=UPI0023B7F7EF|nr:aldo-keto reductase family 1 member B1-like [Hylaeus volcanicus]XP_053971916.1 aldo-keto reductase family 1 member B1-like [Hylaeus volcanicus]
MLDLQKLSTGYSMPLVGFGTYKIRGRDTVYQVIDESLNVGFRSIDTAEVYQNEEDIGYALNSLLPKYNLQREDIFITTKLAPSYNGNLIRIEESVQRSLKALNITYIDLYLIHWPGATRLPENSTNNQILRTKTWDKLVELKKQGLLKSIGVSNYTINHLEDLMQYCQDVPPAVNQVECHPHYRQEELIKYCNEKGIHVQAYSSLGTSSNTNLLKDPTVTLIASRLNVSPARLLLKWALQQNIGIIPKAVKREHIGDNIQLNFTIDKEDMKVLSSLPQHKYCWDPSNVY